MKHLVRWVYPLLYTLLLGLYLPFYIIRGSRKGLKSVPILQRAGRLPEQLERRPDGEKPRLWIHAVSVGEVTSIRGLVSELESRGFSLVITTTTATGQRVARNLYGSRAEVCFFPLDWKFSCRRYLRAIAPDLVILTETELWPSFIYSVREARIPLLLVNGRLSDGSFRHYGYVKRLTTWMLRSFCEMGMQSRQDRDRAIQLGAPPEKVHHTGNLKFDYSLSENPGATGNAERIAGLFRAEDDSLVWVCGSTHEGEEALLAAVFLSLRSEFHDLHLVVAPRHPHRAESVARQLDDMGLTVCLRSQLQETNGAAPPDVIVLDSVGELAHLYAIADIVFVGGSLVPTGGHNIIEAAHFQKPILFGPHMENFREISKVFLAAYGALQIRNEEELRSRMRELLRDRASRVWLGRNARSVVRQNQGAVRRTMQLIDVCSSRRTGERSPA